MQDKQTLYDMLVTYGENGFYPCHMPGHKRKGSGMLADAFGMDITEIDGFDNLHCAEGVLREAQDRAARLYGSEETFFLINGSTCGVLAAVLTATDRQETILIGRNCHKSVYHAAFLQELQLRYLVPEEIAEYQIFDAIAPEAVEEALERYPECRAVVITSPTYEGVIADIAGIARVVHAKGKILIVDEAHGAHLGLAQGIPENAVRQGADIVIHSLHKTLPSMTQTALLHVNGGRINRMKLRGYLRMLQSSSPSYVLMASMDACISFLEKQSASCFDKLMQHRRNFMEQAKTYAHIQIGDEWAIRDRGYQLEAWDICKVLISVKGSSMSGQELYQTLRSEFHLQLEMAAEDYALAIMTIADEAEDWQRLADALRRIDGRIKKVDTGKPVFTESFPLPEVKMTIAQALHKRYQDDVVHAGRDAFRADSTFHAGDGGKEAPLAQAMGQIVGEFINLYPPGIPILAPGEMADEKTIGRIQRALDMGLPVQGVSEAGTVVIL
ncbi:MAG: aminotransferase class V-fold PLP-dependent enzyme [Muribaculaceae bacterium]|nr:aminotransferase class V-fold PLP-dependent enzyme [Muribaculaceae bacterium]